MRLLLYYFVYSFFDYNSGFEVSELIEIKAEQGGWDLSHISNHVNQELGTDALSTVVTRQITSNLLKKRRGGKSHFFGFNDHSMKGYYRRGLVATSAIFAPAFNHSSKRSGLIYISWSYGLLLHAPFTKQAPLHPGNTLCLRLDWQL